jgi:hypothetical protein
LLDRLARRWSQGWTVTRMGRELELSTGAVVGIIVLGLESMPTTVSGRG